MASSTTAPVALPGPYALTPGREQPSGTKVRELAHEFESMLLLQMLRQMRQSMTMWGGEDGEGMPGLGNGTLTDTMDVEVARQLSLAGGLGIADLIVNAFEQRQESAPDSPPEQTTRGSQTAGEPLRRSPDHSAGAESKRMQSAAVVSATATTAVGEPTAGPARGEAGVPLPIHAPLSSRFGWRSDPLGRGMRFHRGIDVRAAYGRPVPVAAAGRVVFAGEQGAYGMTVVVEHGPGLQTRYAHLSASLVREGQSVAVGETIGRVGSSGRSTGPHLHFEVIKDGHRIDPERAAAQYARASLKEAGPGADSPNGGASLARAAEE